MNQLDIFSIGCEPLKITKPIRLIELFAGYGSYNYMEGVKIRKLTPKECFRLMGVSDADYEKIAKNQSDSSLYHLAGDSIITNCLMAIFKEML